MKRVGFSEVTGVRALFFRNLSVGEIPPKAGRGQNSPIDKLLKRPARKPWPPAHRAYAPEGTEEKPILFKKI